MTSLQKAGRWLYKCYVGVGIVAMGAMALSVIFTVIMRYFFNISFVALEQGITLMFTFTTFWGIGACLLENEHIVIDFFIDRMKPAMKRVVNIFNYILVLIVNVMLVYYCMSWIATAGSVMAKALPVQAKYLYIVMPIGFAIGAVCSVIKLILLITNKDISFRPETPELETLDLSE